MEIKEFKAGQTAYMRGDPLLRRRNCEDLIREVTVGKIGRKYLTAVNDSGNEIAKFESTEGNDYLAVTYEYGALCRLYPSREEAEADLECERLRRWLMQAAEWRKAETYTLQQLRAVKEILEPEDGTSQEVLQADKS